VEVDFYGLYKHSLFQVDLKTKFKSMIKLETNCPVWRSASLIYGAGSGKIFMRLRLRNTVVLLYFSILLRKLLFYCTKFHH
jgi:hypothetical protein